MRIESLLKHAALHYPQEIALSEWNGSTWQEIHYAALYEKAMDFSAQLTKQGFMPGERVVLMLHNQIHAIVALWGIWLARMTAVLIDPDLPIPVLEDQMMIADAKIIILEKEKQATFKTLFQVMYRVTVCHEGFEWHHDNQLQSNTTDQDCSLDIATLIFTSGTTGHYKAVMLTHDNYLYLYKCYQPYTKHFEKKCLITVLPIFHVAGLYTSFLEPLFVGGKVVFFRYFSVEALQEGFQKYHPYILTAVPRLLEVFDQKMQGIVNEKGLFSKIIFAVMRETAYFFEKYLHVRLGKLFFKALHQKFGGNLFKIFTGSAALPYAVQKHFLAYGFELLCSYGLTETCGPITFSNAKTRFIPGNVGHCVDPASLWISEKGEVVYRGFALMQGYFRDDIATKQAIVNGCLHTQDLGTIDRAGNLNIIGRIKELIIFSDGKKAMPVQIEKQYIFSGEIKEFAVFDAVVDGLNAAVIAFVPEEGVDVEKIRANIFRRASELKSPYRIADVMRIDALPRSNTLKIQRYLLREKYLIEKEKHKKMDKKEVFHYALSELMDCFSEVLPDKKDCITKDITFAELGIDSFCAVQITNKINKRFHLTLSPTTFWFAHNITELYAHMGGNMSQEKKTVNPRHKSKKVAIVGVECVFPGSDSYADYWQNMLAGKDAIIELPSSRWSNEAYYDAYSLAPGKTNSRVGGFIDLCDNFPGELFGLKNRVVESMDPQQKILMLLVKKLLDDFHIDEKTRKNTGFYLGSGFPDYMLKLTRLFPPERINSYSGIGMADFSSIGRIAYHFGLEGPAILIKTACSSSLVAVHQAVRALQTGDCDIAIAGGVNLVLSPDISVSLTKGGFLSPEGRCKSFDASANGYVRAEGCGLLLLKNYEDAVSDGNPIFAVIEGSAINQDGASNGITAPNGKAQVRCYEAALQEANIRPDQVQFIEAHGSGTQLGDAIEMQSLQFVYDKNRTNEYYVGAVKSMIGHCESAAGIAGLIKTIAVLQHQKIPPNLHYQSPNPNISFEGSYVQLPTKVLSFQEVCLFAAVSSFGVAGTNAHMVLRKP